MNTPPPSSTGGASARAGPEGSSSGTSTAPTGLPVVAALRCPHCHSPMSLAAGAEELLCPACGGSFRIAPVPLGSTSDDVRTLGRFLLLERVGQGGFGAVWRARDTQLDRIVALKIPHAALLSMPGCLERLQREVRAAAQLRHSGIVRLYEVATVGELPVLVSDFIEGVPLKDLLQARPLTFREAAALTAEVADALDYAHGLGLVHRDVKPGNIMIERPRTAGPDGAVGKPILVDLGLVLREEAEIVLTVEGQIIGTPAFMSPEQASGASHRVDRRSDVYSLGVVLYQLLCGELPFRGSKAMLIHQVRHEEPRPPRRVNDRIPRDLETICLKAMAKQPAWRYASACELAEDLRRFLRGEPIKARPVGRPERVWRWCLRNKALAVSAGLLALAGLALVALSVGYNLQQARALAESRKLAATLALDRGLAESEQGNVDGGLLWLARSLETAPSDAAALRQLARANLAAWQRWACPLRTVLKHPGTVSGGTFGRHGRVVLTRAADNTARAWDATTGQPLGPALVHAVPILAAALSADGSLAATVDADNTVRLWRTAAGERLAVLPHRTKVFALAFSPDGKDLVTGSADGLSVWDTGSGRRREARVTKGETVRALAFSADGKTFALGSTSGTAELRCTGTAEPVPTSFAQHGSVVLAVAFSPDGRIMATASKDRTVVLHDIATGAALATLPHAAPVTLLAFSQDGRRLLTGSADNALRLWDAATGKPVSPALFLQRPALAAVLGPNGNRILTVGPEGSAELREPFGGGLRHCLTVPGPLPADRASTVGLLGSPLGQGPVLAAAALYAGRAEKSIRIVDFSPDGRLLLTGGGEVSSKIGHLRLWHTATGLPAAPAVRHEGLIVSAVFSPDGRAILTGSSDDRARLVETATGRLRCPPLAHRGWVYAVALSPDGRLAVTGSVDGAHLWDTGTGKLLAFFPHAAEVVAVAFHPDGKRLLTGCAAGGAALWDTVTRQRLHTLAHGGAVEAVAFSPDGKVALTASQDRTARLWDVATGRVLAAPLSHTDKVHAAAFSRDGRRVLTGSADKTARLWEAATATPLGPPLLHQGPVAAVAFHPGGKLALTGSKDRTARLWDVATGKPVGPALAHQGFVHTVAFSPDGGACATASEDGSACVWDTPGALTGDDAAVVLWAQVLTGLELDAHDTARPLDADTWRQRRQRLLELGSPPLP